MNHYEEIGVRRGAAAIEAALAFDSLESRIRVLEFRIRVFEKLDAVVYSVAIEMLRTKLAEWKV